MGSYRTWQYNSEDKSNILKYMIIAEMEAQLNGRINILKCIISAEMEAQFAWQEQCTQVYDYSRNGSTI